MQNWTHCLESFQERLSESIYKTDIDLHEDDKNAQEKGVFGGVALGVGIDAITSSQSPQNLCLRRNEQKRHHR